MKNILLALLLSTGLTFAADDAPKTEVTTDTTVGEAMQEMEKTLAFIQKGFLYNNEEMIVRGTTDLKKAAQNIKNFIVDDKDIKDGDFNPRRYARNESRAISNLSEDILKNFQTGAKSDAVDAYNNIVHRCLSCHKIIRKW